MFTCFCKPNVDNDELSLDSSETQEKIIKMVLLGPSSSGKTTIIKQFKKMSSSCDAADIHNISSYIKDTLLINMKKLCTESLALEQSFAGKKAIQSLRNDMFSLRETNESHGLTKDIALKINEDDIKTILQQTDCFKMNDNMEYFLNKITEIANDDYVATFEDYVRIKKISIGFSSTKFMKSINNLGEYMFDVIDVGGTRSERKKWWNNALLMDPNLNIIVYVVPISDYDLTLFEDNGTNRLIDALDLFKEILFKADWLLKDKPLVLLFNKYDLYLEKIKTVPITVCFDDFARDKMSPNDADEVIKFIANKFLDILIDSDVEFKDDLKIFRTTALDTNNIQDVFNKIMPQVVFGQNIDFAFNLTYV